MVEEDTRSDNGLLGNNRGQNGGVQVWVGDR